MLDRYNDYLSSMKKTPQEAKLQRPSKKHFQNYQSLPSQNQMRHIFNHSSNTNYNEVIKVGRLASGLFPVDALETSFLQDRAARIDHS